MVQVRVELDSNMTVKEFMEILDTFNGTVPTWHTHLNVVVQFSNEHDAIDFLVNQYPDDTPDFHRSLLV